MQYLIKNKNSLLVKFLLFLLLFVYFSLLPNFYNLIQPDSYSYISGSKMQKHLYTVIIKTFTVSNYNFDLLINFNLFDYLIMIAKNVCNRAQITNSMQIKLY